LRIAESFFGAVKIPLILRFEKIGNGHVREYARIANFFKYSSEGHFDSPSEFAITSLTLSVRFVLFADCRIKVTVNCPACARQFTVVFGLVDIADAIDPFGLLLEIITQ